MDCAVLFDLDGTLLNTLEDLTDSTNHILAQFGYPTHSLAIIRSFVGNGALRQISLAVPAGADPLPVLQAYKAYYADHCQIKTAPYPGILEALQETSRMCPVAIVSNKPDPAVKRLCAQYFPGVYALGETPECPRKPAPDMVHAAMAALGVTRCIYVGDSEVDVITAKNAEVPCISVLWGFRDREEIASHGGSVFCERPEDLPQIIRSML